jgi:hypothetical protein
MTTHRLSDGEKKGGQKYRWTIQANRIDHEPTDNDKTGARASVDFSKRTGLITHKLKDGEQTRGGCVSELFKQTGLITHHLRKECQWTIESGQD